jgi:tetratricopeptide (TPR) repeat protein
MASFNEVLKLNSRATAARLQLSRLNLVRGNVDASLELARQAVRDEPSNPVAHLVLTDALLGKRQTAEAEQEVKQLLSKLPNASPLHVRAGRLALLKNDLPSARRSFDRALALEPRSLDAVAGVAAVSVAQRRPDQARALVDQYLQKAPNDSGLMMLAARTYIADRDTAGAQTLLERVVERDPANVSASSMLGQVYLAQKNLEAARERFEDVARRQPEDVTAEMLIASILEGQGKRDAARKRYEAILERQPNVGPAANNLAWIYAEDGNDLERARELAQRARRLMPSDARVSDTLGWVYHKQRLPSLAIPEFQHSISNDPTNATYHYHLGLAYLEGGEVAKGKEALRQALKLRPDFDGAEQARAALAR